jgi:ligand-binding sensor domain-containing protein
MSKEDRIDRVLVLVLIVAALAACEGKLGHAPTATCMPKLSATAPLATATPTTAVAHASLFQLVPPDSGLPDGEIHHLWIDTNGHLWVATDAGVFLHSDEDWTQLLDEPVERIQGVDAQGRVWVILGEEAAVAAYDPSETWTLYGPAQGWVVPPPFEYLSPGYGDGLVTDPQGRVWFTIGRGDLRSFDPTTRTWSSFSATDLGFDPPHEDGYQGHFLTDVGLSEDQRLWVGDCIGIGEILSGQGLVRSEGGGWAKAAPTAGECVRDIERDSSGRMWVGGFDALLRYNPADASWSRIALPSWDRRQLVLDIALDADDNPWIEILRYGGASPMGEVARYHLQEGEWLLDFEGWFSSLALGAEGVAWLCSEGVVYVLEGGELNEVGNVGGLGCQIIVDGESRVWIRSDAGLWRQESAE